MSDVPTSASQGTAWELEPALRNGLRVFFVGGISSFRALFHWLSPWLYVPIMLISPLFEILFFVYLGRASHTGSDRFFVVGNALAAIAVATFFGASFTIDGEREGQTLATLIGSPASRIALFLGRSLPVMVNGAVVAVWALGVTVLLLGISIPAGAVLPLGAAIAIGAYSSAGAGLVLGAAGLRFRNVGITANLLFAFVLIFSGANIPRALLPAWMRAVGDVVPLTHAIEAAHRAVAGAAFGSVAGPLAAEAALGTAYGAGGYALLRLMEARARRDASLEVF